MAWDTAPLQELQAESKRLLDESHALRKDSDRLRRRLRTTPATPVPRRFAKTR
jgi:regulator of replication initiation timing